MRLGFVCAWERDPRQTWSGTPWNLWQALARQTDVADLGPHVSPLTRRAMKVLYRAAPQRSICLDLEVVARMGRSERATGEARCITPPL